MYVLLLLKKWSSENWTGGDGPAKYMYEIKASDVITRQTKHINLASFSSKRAETGGLHVVIKIACGTRGETAHFVTNSNNDVTTVLIKFDNEQVGVKACQSSQYCTVHPGVVPVSKVEVVFLAKKAWY